MLAAIIPAAGESTRMGRPKALLVYRGKTFLQAILDTTRALAVDRAVIAIAQHGYKVLSNTDLTGVTVVTNAATPSAGEIGSIRAAIVELLSSDVDGAILWPVDQPHVAQGTVKALIDAFKNCDCAVAVPRFNGKRGHPVIFGRAVFEELLRAPDSEGARAVVRADPGRVLEVDVDDPAVLEDIDTPDAYEALIRRSQPHA